MNSKTSRDSQDLLQEIEDPNSELRQITRSILKGHLPVDALKEDSPKGAAKRKPKSTSSSKSISIIAIIGVAAIGLAWMIQSLRSTPDETAQIIHYSGHGLPPGQADDLQFVVGISPHLGVGDETESIEVENRQVVAAPGSNLLMSILSPATDEHSAPISLIRIRNQKIRIFRQPPSRFGTDEASKFGPFKVSDGEEIWWAIATTDMDMIEEQDELSGAFLSATPDAPSMGNLRSSLASAGVEVQTLNWLVVNPKGKQETSPTSKTEVQDEKITRSEEELFRERSKIEEELCKELDNQAWAAFQAGDYENAERYSRETLEIKTRIYGKDHVNVALCQSNLAAVCIDRRKYESARRLLEIAIPVYQKSRLKAGYDRRNDRNYASALNNLGSLQNSTREFGQAIKSLEEALAVYQEAYRGKTADQMDSISSVHSNLGFAYEASGILEKAQNAYEMAREIDQQQFDNARRPTVRQATNLAMSLNNLATVTSKLGDHDEAEKLLQESLSKLGKDNLRRITVLVNLTRIVGELQNQKEAGLRYARECHELAIRVCDHKNASEHLARACENLAIARWWFDDDKNGIYELARQGAQIRSRLAVNYFLNSTEPQSLNYSLGQFGSPGLPITFRTGSAANTEDLYELVWNRRGLLQGILSHRRKLFDRAFEGDPQLVTDLMAVDRLIAINLRNDQARLKELTSTREQLTATILSQYGTTDTDQAPRPSASDLRKLLPARSAFVDIVSYLKPVKENNNAVPAVACYGAFVLQAGSIKFLELGTTSEINTEIDKWLQRIEAGGEVSAGIDVANHVWFPIKNLLEDGTNTLYMCSDGGLNQLPWGALPSDDSESARFLIRDYTFASCADGIQLARSLADEGTGKTDPGAVWAGKTLLVSDIPVEPWQRLGLDCRALAQVESRLIEMLGTETVGKPVPLSGNSATIDEFEKQIGGCSNAILWSHAFVYEPAPKEDKREFPTGYVMASRENPLDRFPLTKSAMLLACPESLTGQFVSTLDLDHIDTVLLMGCGTACGDRYASEGVAGFQLAFNRAGVTTSIASLWNVNEIVARKFVEAYFGNLKNGHSKIDSFRFAQLAVLDDRSADNQLPLHWACWKFCGNTQF